MAVLKHQRKRLNGQEVSLQNTAILAVGKQQLLDGGGDLKMTSGEKNKSGKLKIIITIIIKRNDEIDKYRLVSTFLVCGHVHNLYTTVIKNLFS